jgi:hypothetical protein
MHISLPSYYKFRSKNTTELKTELKTDLIIFLLSVLGVLDEETIRKKTGLSIENSIFG